MTMLRHSNLEWKFIIHRYPSSLFVSIVAHSHSLSFCPFILFHSLQFSAILLQDHSFVLRKDISNSFQLFPILFNSLQFAMVLEVRAPQPSATVTTRPILKEPRMFSETNFQIFSTLLNVNIAKGMNKNAFFKQSISFKSELL